MKKRLKNVSYDLDGLTLDEIVLWTKEMKQQYSDYDELYLEYEIMNVRSEAPYKIMALYGKKEEK